MESEYTENLEKLTELLDSFKLFTLDSWVEGHHFNFKTQEEFLKQCLHMVIERHEDDLG